MFNFVLVHPVLYHRVLSSMNTPSTILYTPINIRYILIKIRYKPIKTRYIPIIIQYRPYTDYYPVYTNKIITIQYIPNFDGLEFGIYR